MDSVFYTDVSDVGDESKENDIDKDKNNQEDFIKPSESGPVQHVQSNGFQPDIDTGQRVSRKQSSKVISKLNFK